MKNNKNGFTLFEILTVVVIISVLGVSGIIAFNKSIKIQNQKKYDILISQIIEATKVLVETDPDKLAIIDSVGYLVVTVGDLQEKSLIGENLINPVTRETISTSNYVRVSKNASEELIYTYNIAS